MPKPRSPSPPQSPPAARPAQIVRFDEPGDVLAFLSRMGQLLQGEEQITAIRSKAGSHLILTTHRLLVAKAQVQAGDGLAAIDEPHQVEFSVTLRIQGQRVYEVEDLCPDDVARLQRSCRQLAPVTGLQRVREVLAHLGLEPGVDSDCRITTTPRGSVLDVLGRRFAFDSQETPRHQRFGDPHGP